MDNDQASRLRRARLNAGYKSAQAAANAFGWEAPAYRHHENGTRSFEATTAARYAKAFKVDAAWLLCIESKVPDLPQTRGASDGDGTIALKRINLAFAMGDGTNLDDYVEEGLIEFDANLLRAISTSPASRLVVADGVGDSMRPTLLDSDMIVIDTLQTDIKADRIYAMSMYGSGAVKRLSPASRSEVEVISDNPDLASRVRIVPRDEIRIIGRVIWSGRRH